MNWEWEKKDYTLANRDSVEWQAERRPNQSDWLLQFLQLFILNSKTCLILSLLGCMYNFVEG